MGKQKQEHALEQGRHGRQVRHLNLVYDLPTYTSLKEWKKRAEELRLHILVSCGMYPMPERCPLNPCRAVSYEESDFLVERVAFESLPGYFVTGSLFRPKGKKGKFPALLHPHGHFERGRLNEPDIIRSIALARAGFVVLSYDMIGYNDHFQLSHRAEETPREHLWGFSRAGLQLWNSTRALDFLLSLPEVDSKRTGCSGISGGGTQTFLLAAVDERVKVANPVKMVSAQMQGGCICENPPNLRVDTTNPEITALIAPRPLLLISDSGDWTDDCPQKVFPFIRSIYRLHHAEEKVTNAHYSEGHQFGKPAREAYYEWLVRWLMPAGSKVSVDESAPVPDFPKLRVWGDQLPKPTRVPEGEEVVKLFISGAQRQIETLLPHDRESLTRFQRTMQPALQRTLHASRPAKVEGLWLSTGSKNVPAQYQFRDTATGLQVKGRWYSRPATNRKALPVVLVVEPAEGVGGSLCQSLAQAGFTPLAITVPAEQRAGEPSNVQYFTTYNPTETAEHVRMILLALAFWQNPLPTIHLVGLGERGLEVLLARALWQGRGKTVVDTAQFDPDSDDDYARRLYTPGLCRVGGLRTALALVAPNPLWMFNLHSRFPTEWVQKVYRMSNAQECLQMTPEGFREEAIVEWLK